MNDNDALIAPPSLPERAPRGFSLPDTTTLVASDSACGQSLEALLCDSGVRCRRSAHFELESLLATSSQAVVVFTEGFALPELLWAAAAVHAQRPSLTLLFVASRPAMRALTVAFEDSWSPPTILRDSAPARVIRDALAVAFAASAFEALLTVDEKGVSAGSRARAAATLRALFAAREPVLDREFDVFLPAPLRVASVQYWTPLEVIRRAAEWLEEHNIRNVVDVGSGVGKFCVAGALASHCQFVGIEHRPQLASIARDMSRLFGVEDRVSIIDGCFGNIDVPAAECYYLYNPFEENLLPAEEALDTEVELNADRFRHDLRAFRALARSAPLGTYVLTYNGVGGKMPDCLDEICVDRELPTVLRLLRKVRW